MDVGDVAFCCTEMPDAGDASMGRLIQAMAGVSGTSATEIGTLGQLEERYSPLWTAPTMSSHSI